MLTSYLKSGDVIDFAIDNTMPYSTPSIELLVTDKRLAKLASLKLTPIEALTLAEHLQQMVTCVGEDITHSIRREEPLLNLHPRAEQLLIGAGLNPATGRHIGNGKMEENTSTDHGRTGRTEPLPQATPSSPFDGHDQEESADAERSDVSHRDRSEAGGPLQSRGSRHVLHGGEWATSIPFGQSADTARSVRGVAEEVVEGRPDGIGSSLQIDVDIDENWVASIGHNRNDEVAFLESQLQHVEAECDSCDGSCFSEAGAQRCADAVSATLTRSEDLWQDELDRFIDAFRLEPASIEPQPDHSLHFDIHQETEGQPTIAMPFCVSVGAKVIKSPRVRKLLEEVAAQAFHYGANWEAERADAINGGN